MAIVVEEEAEEAVIGLDHHHQISINTDPMAAIEMITTNVGSAIAKNEEEAEHHLISIDTYQTKINHQ